MKTNLTDTEYGILKHTLGADQRQSDGAFYRNRFVTGEKSTDYDICNGLVVKGIFDVRRNVEMFAGDDMFWANDKGIEIANIKWPRTK